MALPSLGAHLRGRRLDCGLSLRALAARVEVSPAYLSDLEWGRRHPSARVLARLAYELGEDVAELRRYRLDALQQIASDMVAAVRELAEAGISARELRAFVRRRMRRGAKKGAKKG